MFYRKRIDALRRDVDRLMEKDQARSPREKEEDSVELRLEKAYIRGISNVFNYDLDIAKGKRGGDE